MVAHSCIMTLVYVHLSPFQFATGFLTSYTLDDVYIADINGRSDTLWEVAPPIHTLIHDHLISNNSISLYATLKLPQSVSHRWEQIHNLYDCNEQQLYHKFVLIFINGWLKNPHLHYHTDATGYPVKRALVYARFLCILVTSLTSRSIIRQSTLTRLSIFV